MLATKAIDFFYVQSMDEQSQSMDEQYQTNISTKATGRTNVQDTEGRVDQKA
jgi:hypothetical protein